MKLRQINSETAIDKKGNGWFRMKAGERHSQWVKCVSCGKTIQYYWTDWPNKESQVCDVCMIWTEE